MRLPFTAVPFVDPSSCTTHAERVLRSVAWARETPATGRQMALSASRPMETL